MCTTCGCGQDAKPTVTNLTIKKIGSSALDHKALHDPAHPPQDHRHEHPHEADPASPSLISLEKEILAKNNSIAEQNRKWFGDNKVLALNLVSSPGAGKTTLLERTLTDLKEEVSINVIEGDQETSHDAERIRATGCKVVQINTGTGCHLEAGMLSRGLRQLQPPEHSILMIENVGNLVCPALFDLGEHARIVILSVTEGTDKPVKYPHLFRTANLMIVNKIDLLPYVDFDLDECLDYARQINPNIQILQVSATQGDGLGNWYQWLKSQFTLATSPPPTS